MVRATGAEVEVVSPLMKRWRYHTMRFASIPSRLMGRGMAWPKHPFLLGNYGKMVDRAVRRIEPDVVFSPGTNVIAYSSFLRPTVFWSDAPFGAMADYYPWPQYQKLTKLSRAYGMQADTRSLRHSVAAIYRSNWARDAAIAKHQADPARVHVVPLSGNVLHQWTLEETRAIVARRLKSPWKFLFNGADWHRKGGDRAIAILNAVMAWGQPCELRVVGVTPPAASVAEARFPVISHDRRNLNDRLAREFLVRLTHESLFLLVPSAAETYGFVYCEAMNAGVPSIASATGGVPDLISDGRTGLLLQAGDTADATARRILEAGRPDRYVTMAEACWKEWRTRFSEQAILRQLTPILEQAARTR